MPFICVVIIGFVLLLIDAFLKDQAVRDRKQEQYQRNVQNRLSEIENNTK